MTVASHGFPGNDSNVHHPKANGSIIGEVLHRIRDTDIALVKLKGNISFENEIFQSELEPDGVSLRGIKDPFEIKRFDLISMDNPFTGLIDGQFLAVARTRLPTNAHSQHTWVEQLWQWLGQNSNAIPVDGSCGSSLWDSDGYVICFFRSLDKDNMGIGVAAQKLVWNGYTLV